MNSVLVHDDNAEFQHNIVPFIRVYIARLQKNYYIKISDDLINFRQLAAYLPVEATNWDWVGFQQNLDVWIIQNIL